MVQPENPAGRFVRALSNRIDDSNSPATLAPKVPEPTSAVDRPVPRRRGVPIGSVLALMLFSAGIGAAVWQMFGEQPRSLDLARYAVPLARPPLETLSNPEAGQFEALLGAVKALQEAQARSADQLETILRSQASQQTSAKTTSDVLAALSAKIDTVQPTAPSRTALAKKPGPAAQRKKRSGRPNPPAATRELVGQPEPAPDSQADLRR